MPLDAAIRRDLLRRPSGVIALGFGAGLSPVAPGTVGSLVALAPWLALRELPPLAYALALAFAFALGVFVCGAAARRIGGEDPGAVVWDEFVGLWIALAPLASASHGMLWICAGFILFRIFDVWKPWPVSWADENVKGGLGVMLDDVLAGAYAALALVLLQRVF
ncbi:MAG TPA: phosphatidylglycerophosphatase A [Rudaea sp.]|nr:phosphatidylglycerophosphatase A [Rudaea sp.]